MSSESQENNELQKLLNAYSPNSDDTNIDNNSNTQSAIKHVLTPDLLANSVASITKMLARKSGIEALAFTEEDKKDFTNALEPFADKLDDILKYMPYLPLGIFAIGYGIRVYGGYKDKKKLESERKKKSIDEKRKEYKENIAKNEVENNNTMIVKSNSAIMM
jgi:hypothetical protein